MTVTWITGASSGIGEALARRLAQDGRKVAVSARGAAALDGLAAAFPGAIAPVPLDVTDAAACAAAVARIEDGLGPIELAVLNAGTHRPMSAQDFSAATLRRLVEINLFGVAHCLEPLLARMVARRRGHIAIVASVAGYGGLPTAAAYGPTKAALINMAESLRIDCENLGIRLQLVDPGFVKTPLTDRNEFPMPFLMPVEAAVDAFVAGLATDRFEITFPRRFALLLRLLNMLPYRAYFALVRRMTGA
ncbi:MAG: SDR family NAD(P)-dependent oxidoreductase [Rhodospirillales bacterium]|jgi:NADP-dependent 3-hydroxy acid dehydrogenase YdfG